MADDPVGGKYLSPEGSCVQGLPAIPVLDVHAHTVVQEELSCPQVSVGASYVQLEDRRGTPLGTGPTFGGGNSTPYPCSRASWGLAEWGTMR